MILFVPMYHFLIILDSKSSIFSYLVRVVNQLLNTQAG